MPTHEIRNHWANRFRKKRREIADREASASNFAKLWTQYQF
jgi:hypothetical protein